MKKHFVMLAFFFAFTMNVFAHNGMEHIMGTVVSISESGVVVKTMDGKTQTVTVNGATKYLKGHSPSTIKDLKAGDHVVIHAAKKDGQLTAGEVKTGTMKGMPARMKMDRGQAPE